MAQKVLLIILGVVMFIGGAYCMMTPGLTYMVIAPLAGFGMIIDAVASFFVWNNLRKDGVKDTFMLIGAILSLVLGVIMLGSFGAQLVYDLMVAYLVAFWLVVSGIMRIVSGWKMGKNILMIVVGVLIALCGITGFFNPISIMLALGMMIGISIFMSGIGIFALAFVGDKQ